MAFFLLSALPYVFSPLERDLAVNMAWNKEINDTYFICYIIFLDLYFVVPQSRGSQRAFGYWACQMGYGNSGYLKPFWMMVQ